MLQAIISTAFTVLTMTTASMVLGADPKSPPPVEPKAVCEKILLYVLQDKPSDAFAVVRAAGIKPGEDREWSRFVSATELQFIEAKHKYGEPLGWELVRENRVNETLRRYVYVFKYDSGVLCWEFVFYRPRHAWKLYTWSYGERLETLWPSSSVGQPQDPTPSDHHP
jgi:hypothetical protein